MCLCVLVVRGCGRTRLSAEACGPRAFLHKDVISRDIRYTTYGFLKPYAAFYLYLINISNGPVRGGHRVRPERVPYPRTLYGVRYRIVLGSEAKQSYIACLGVLSVFPMIQFLREKYFNFEDRHVGVRGGA